MLGRKGKTGIREAKTGIRKFRSCTKKAGSRMKNGSRPISCAATAARDLLPVELVSAMRLSDFHPGRGGNVGRPVSWV